MFRETEHVLRKFVRVCLLVDLKKSPTDPVPDQLFRTKEMLILRRQEIIVCKETVHVFQGLERLHDTLRRVELALLKKKRFKKRALDRFIEDIITDATNLSVAVTFALTSALTIKKEEPADGDTTPTRSSLKGLVEEVLSEKKKQSGKQISFRDVIEDTKSERKKKSSIQEVSEPSPGKKKQEEAETERKKKSLDKNLVDSTNEVIERSPGKEVKKFRDVVEKSKTERKKKSSMDSIKEVSERSSEKRMEKSSSRSSLKGVVGKPVVEETDPSKKSKVTKKLKYETDALDSPPMSPSASTKREVNSMTSVTPRKSRNGDQDSRSPHKKHQKRERKERNEALESETDIETEEMTGEKMFEMAERLFHGEGCQRDFKNSVRLYRRAAEEDFPPAQNFLGMMYENGIGTEVNLDQASRWYQRAAELGHSNAMNNLGRIYEMEEGPCFDHDLSFQLFLAAAELKHIDAMNNVAHCYETGKGTPPNVSRARYWYTLACEAGHAKAQNNLGAMVFRGGDGREALEYFQRAADQGNIVAMNNVGICLETVAPKDIHSEELERARMSYWNAAEGGHLPARLNLASLLLRRFDDPQGALHQFRVVLRNSRDEKENLLIRIRDSVDPPASLQVRLVGTEQVEEEAARGCQLAIRILENRGIEPQDVD